MLIEDTKAAKERLSARSKSATVEPRVLSVEKGSIETPDHEDAVVITKELVIDGHKMWEYYYTDQQMPATRMEQWMRDDEEFFAIIGCFEHSIEQVVRGETLSPFHDGNQCRKSDEQRQQSSASAA